MENLNNKMTQEEIDDLKKSLATLGLDEAEIDGYIQKAIEKQDAGGEPTIAEKAEGGKKEGDEPEGGKKEGDEPDEKVEKGTLSAEDIEKCSQLEAKKAKIQKAIDDLKAGRTTSKELDNTDGDQFGKSIINDINKSLGERLEDIQKSIRDEFTAKVEEQGKIIKGLQDELKRIGDMPLGTKAVRTKANFFEKGLNSEGDEPEEKQLSITKDRDELIKGMQDEFEKATDPDVRSMLQNGISDYAVNVTPTQHGIAALRYLSQKRNITLGQ